MKTLSVFKTLFLICFSLLLFSSCKKEINKEDFLAQAKEWYLKSNTDSKVSLKSSNNILENIITRFEWGKSKSFILSEGKEVAVVPMQVSTTNKSNLQGCYLLLIYKDTNDNYTSQVVYNRDKDYFNALTNSIVESSFKTAEKNKTIKPLSEIGSKSKDKTMLIKDEPNCIDWYWTVYALDEYGNPLYIISETYLYTTCPDGVSDPQPEPEEPEPIVEFGEPDDTPIGITTEQSSEGKKIFNVSWYCYKISGRTLRFKSYEKIETVRDIMGPNWLISNITHSNITPEGTIDGQTASCILNWSQGETNMTSTWAKMTLNFKDKRTLIYRGVLRTHYSPDITASRSWGVGDLINN